MSKPVYWDSACISLSRKDPILRLIIEQYRDHYLVPSSNPFRTLCKSIIGQQISTIAAKSIYERFENLCSVKPQHIVKVSVKQFQSIGLSRQKIEYLKLLSKTILTKELNLSELKNSDETEAFNILTKLKGVGPWTAQMFLIFYCSNPNIFPSNDVGLINGLKKFYNKDSYVDDNNPITFKELWSPWATVGTFYIWRALDGEPLNY